MQFQVIVDAIAPHLGRLSIPLSFQKMESDVPFLGIWSYTQYDAWLAIAETADWKTPEEAKNAHPKALTRKGVDL